MSTLANQTIPRLARTSANLLVSSDNLKLVVAKPGTAPVEQSALPMLATPNDVRDLIRFLKQRPEGVSLVEAFGEIKKRILEPRKVEAYEHWGIITRVGNRLQLSPLGWEFARKLALEADLFCTILNSLVPYRAVLEWARDQQLTLLTQDEVTQFWRAHFPAFLTGQPAREVESGIVSFLHICQSAELGTLTIGKRGQPARLRIDPDALQSYVAAAPRQENKELENQLLPALHSVVPPNKRFAQKLRVSISLSGANEVMTPLITLFSLLQIEAEIVTRARHETMMASEHNFTALRSCEAGVFVLTLEDCEQRDLGVYHLTPEAQMEISAAYLFYNRKIVLLKERRIQLPEAMQAISQCEFNDEGIRWTDGLALTQELMQFHS